jgi:hypothetical protein
VLLLLVFVTVDLCIVVTGALVTVVVSVGVLIVLVVPVTVEYRLDTWVSHGAQWYFLVDGFDVRMCVTAFLCLAERV